MALYIYPKDSPIDRLYVLKTEKGEYRAYLHASHASDTNIRKDVVKTLESHKWHGIPTTHLDMQCLEVRGFKTEDELFDLLRSKNYLHGKHKKLPTLGDNLTFVDIARQRSLQASGIMYALGDYGFFIYGLKGKSPLDMSASLAYAAGTWALVGFGQNSHAKMDIEDISKRMVTHLQEHNKSIPTESSLTRISEEHHKSLLEQTSDIFTKYPSELFCAVTFLAGGFVAASSLQKLKTAPVGHHFEHMLDVGLGTCTMASCAIGGLVKEKHRDPDEPSPTTDVEKAWDWVREKPLRLAGYGLMVSTLFHAISTTKVVMRGRKLPVGSAERAEVMEPILGRAQFVVCNMLAEFMMSISSKGHGDGVETDDSVGKSMIAVASEMIAKKPPEFHKELIDTMTKYLGDQKVLGLGNEYTRQELVKGVQSAMKNPWATDFVTWRNNPNNPKAEAITDANTPDPIAIMDGEKPKSLANMPVHMQQRVAELPLMEHTHHQA